MDVIIRDPESLHVVAPPPLAGQIIWSVVLHTGAFGAVATATPIYAIWATARPKPKFPKASDVALGVLALYSSLLLLVGPAVLARYPRLLTAGVIVRQRSPFVKALFSLLIMGLSWLVVDSFGTEVSEGQIMIMLSVYVYVFATVRFFKVNDDGGVVDSLSGATFAMMMTLPREFHLRFRVMVGVVLALSIILRAAVEYLEGYWRRMVVAAAGLLE